MYEKRFHRNSQKRFYGDGKIYFIVTKTFQNHPYFKESIFCDLLIEELKLCKKIKRFNLFGFCLIYDHLNLLIQPNDEFDISKVMQFLKRHFSRDMNFILNTNNDEIYFDNEGDIRECRLHYQNKFRLQGGNYENFSKIINTHDEKLKQIKNKFIQKYGNPQFEIPKFKWQKSFYDHVIRGKKDFQNHYGYTVYNYAKHKLPDNWQYTSLNYEEMVDVIEW